jgi:hypothetical protein
MSIFIQGLDIDINMESLFKDPQNENSELILLRSVTGFVIVAYVPCRLWNLNIVQWNLTWPDK